MIASPIDLAIGIDVGYSESRPSTGVVVLDRTSKTLAPGSRPTVTRASAAVAGVRADIARLRPRSVVFCVDGPFAAAMSPRKARLVERFFSSGPFAGTPPRGGRRFECRPRRPPPRRGS